MLREVNVIAMEGNGARPSHLGKGFSEDGHMYTLNTIEQHSVCYTVDCRNLFLNCEKSGTLQAKSNGGFSYNYLNPILRKNDEQFVPGNDISPTLEATDYKEPISICYAIENHPCDSRVTLTDEGIVQTLNARMGTGGGNVPLVLLPKSSCRQDTQNTIPDSHC